MRNKVVIILTKAVSVEENANVTLCILHKTNKIIVYDKDIQALSFRRGGGVGAGLSIILIKGKYYTKYPKKFNPGVRINMNKIIGMYKRYRRTKRRADD